MNLKLKSQLIRKKLKKLKRQERLKKLKRLRRLKKLRKPSKLKGTKIVKGIQKLLARLENSRALKMLLTI